MLGKALSISALLAYVILSGVGLIVQFRAEQPDTPHYTARRAQAIGVALCVLCLWLLFSGSDSIIFLACAMPICSLATLALALRSKGSGSKAVAFASLFYFLGFVALVIYVLQGPLTSIF